MRYPKISSSSAHGSDCTDSSQSGKSRGRSSLDTFVIPNRTRLPSTKVSKPQPADLQIAYGLLRPETANTREKLVQQWGSKSNGSNVRPLCQAASTPLLQSLRLKKSRLTPLPAPLLSVHEQPSRLGACKAATARLSHSGIAGQLSKLFHRHDDEHILEEDSIDSSYATSFAESGSRATSMSGSNRVASRCSSSSSEGTSIHLSYIAEYNRTATKYGLPQFFDDMPEVEKVEKTKRTAYELQRGTVIGKYRDAAR